MCLYSVEQIFTDPKDEDWKEGYKVLSIDDDIMYSPCYSQIFDIGHTYIDIHKGEFICSISMTTEEVLYAYPNGFHIWKDLENAKLDIVHNDEKIVRVKYRKIVAIGKNCITTDLYGDCVVAQEIQICEFVD